MVTDADRTVVQRILTAYLQATAASEYNRIDLGAEIVAAHRIAAEARAEKLVEALRHILGAAHEAPQYGPFDQIDNTGQPYQSADFAEALKKGRVALAAHNAGEGR